MCIDALPPCILAPSCAPHTTLALSPLPHPQYLSSPHLAQDAWQPHLQQQQLLQQPHHYGGGPQPYVYPAYGQVRLFSHTHFFLRCGDIPDPSSQPITRKP